MVKKMKYIGVQLQPDLGAPFDLREIVKKLKLNNLIPEISEGEDDGKYINLHFKTNDVKNTWKEIKTILFSEYALSDMAIVTCEGNEGWDDYLLLYHFDKSVELDEI